MQVEHPVTIDEEHQIRILPVQKFADSQKLANSCKSFVEKITQFEEGIEAYSSAIEKIAQRTEAEKLKAIGQRNMLASEAENRLRKKQELEAQIAQRQAELDRLVAEADSLSKVEQEQQALIQKLVSMEV
ncbi:putative Intraflagellar Transport Protein 20 [Paratrimastix pyriformis]|uniref:Intraflagellar Transport Protein 20 n=1 Tax=Paratrimastix pyriformis TaxID=342808 RepID=A0ABQ8UU25_9EUKA|nr:putative Intraflagellar Transport Protein 20 [Paratrimastix pyriformis]